MQDWRLNGVYDIGEPLGKTATMQVGGDLIVATRVGLIPLSAAATKDSGQLKLASLSRAIAPNWERDAALAASGERWLLVKWTAGGAALVRPPRSVGGNHCYVVETGAWTRFTGWAVAAMAALGDDLYYGDAHGDIMRCDTGGTDCGRPFACRCCFAFDDLGAPGAVKTVHAMRSTWKHLTPIRPRMSVGRDYRPDFPPSPSSAPPMADDTPRWDIALWDKTCWPREVEQAKVTGRWDSVSGHGKALAVQAQLVSSTPHKLDCELVSVDLTYSTGGVAV